MHNRGRTARIPSCRNRHASPVRGVLLPLADFRFHPRGRSGTGSDRKVRLMPGSGCRRAGIDARAPRSPKVKARRQLPGEGARVLERQVNGTRTDGAGVNPFVPVPLRPWDGRGSLAAQTAGAQNVDRDVMFPHFIRQAVAEHVDRRFAGAVEHAATLVGVGRHARTDIDDAAAALFDHDWEHGPAAKVRAGLR